MTWTTNVAFNLESVTETADFALTFTQDGAKGAVATMTVEVALQALVPLAALAAGFCPVAHAGWIAAGGAATYLGIALTYWASRRLTLAPAWVAALWSPCMLLLVYALARSMTLALWRGGVEWRGTRYPLAELKRQSGRW